MVGFESQNPKAPFGDVSCERFFDQIVGFVQMHQLINVTPSRVGATKIIHKLHA